LPNHPKTIRFNVDPNSDKMIAKEELEAAHVEAEFQAAVTGMDFP